MKEQDHPRLEHIVLDSGSTDETPDICTRFPAVRPVTPAPNGLSEKVNHGFSIARDETVGWLNADDYYLPGATSKAVEALKRHLDAALVYCNILHVDEHRRASAAPATRSGRGSFVRDRSGQKGLKHGMNRSWVGPVPGPNSAHLLRTDCPIMKVVLFCGGLGMRIRDADNLPKPMVHIGNRPLLWHVMKYYAHFGHQDFILCLGYRADVIKNYFLNYNECSSNDFILSKGGKNLELLNSDIQDWRITFVDTGINANIGQRLRAVQKHLDGEDEFLANYSDGLTDLALPQQLEHFHRQGKVASFMCVRPNLSYHRVSLQEGTSLVADICPIDNGDVRVNGGFFIFRKEIFEYMQDKEELVNEPFHRLLREQQLVGYVHDGFWASMDTFKDRQQLESLYSTGAAPWELWKTHGRR